MNTYFIKRKCRRRTINSIVRLLEQIQDYELMYYLSIPDTRANKERQDKSGYAVDELSAVIDSLRHLFESPPIYDEYE
jgi:hypothetical protein